MNQREQGVCPACNGTARVTPDDKTREYGIKYGWYDYDAKTDTVPCRNCGAQYQFSIGGTGKVYLRDDNGEPCLHEYTGRTLGRCYTGYTCIHCRDHYTIDSGD